LSEQCSLRPRRYAERVEALGYERVPELVLKPIPEARGPAMRHREGVETPTLAHQNGPGRNCTQPVRALALRPDRVGEVAPDECQRLVAADNLDRPIHPKESESGEEARQPQDVIEVSMRQQHVGQAAKADPSAHQLALGALAAIDQKSARASGDEQCREAPFGGRHRRGSTEKDEIEHRTLPNAVRRDQS
jgi:hypothetical protein